MDKAEAIKITELDENGNKVEYDVIMIYDSDVTDKRYVFYTDGSKTASGASKVRVGFVGEKEGKVIITDVTNPIEQQMLSEIYYEKINNVVGD
ncbi:MAG: DUF1292 domain-containing protein [Clostridia bacterium]|nr:DUF1292 domain-containing protein [Clostridia bacterium]